MGCIKDETLLERYLDDELSPHMAQRVATAVKDCDHCAAFINDMTLIRTSLNESMAQAVANAPLDQLWERIEESIHEQAEPEVAPSLWRRISDWLAPDRLEFSMSAAATAAAVAIMIWIAGAPESHVAVIPSATPVANNVDNTLVVESVEYTGVLIVDMEPENKSKPTVLWHFPDNEQEGS